MICLSWREKMKKLFCVIPLFSFLAFTLACQDTAALAELEKLRSRAKIEEQNKEVVRRYWNGKWNERRPGILDELQTQNVLYHGTSMEMNGLAEYKKVYAIFASAFHDTRLAIDDIIASDDRVMTRVKMTGTHRGDFEGIAPTEKTITLTAYTVFRLVDGKIAEEWEVLDELGMMSQLGMELKPKDVKR
jgi:steroid delta-isomerase-like uncharacterized protein